ncbi:TRAP transporter small permease [Oceaniglobus ichthyenteri]|uniref:TRAP transporter small permease n=1 Tax=Oceaniglobus ichthyenteri TaxID=2136177 RepID=UPI00197CCC43|nr:TRAP transporter small permease [Oceaniglobus ichthyenteri]
MRRFLERIIHLTQVLGQLVLAFMVVTICYDALMRYAFTAPTSWSLEINTFLIIYLAVMTAADVQRTDSHIRITFFADMMPGAAQRAVRALIGIVGAVFCGIMAWRGYLMAASAFEYGERVSSSFGTPVGIPYALVPVGFGLLALQFFFNILDSLLAEDTPSSEDLQQL